MLTFTASGTGAWEAALVNTLAPGDTIVLFDNGHFAALWAEQGERQFCSVRAGCSAAMLPKRPRCRDLR